MRLLSLVTLCLVMGCAHGGAGARAKVEGTQLFEADGALRIDMVQLENARCLLRVRNVDAGPFTNHVFPCELKTENRHTGYVVNYDGHEWTFLEKRENRPWHAWLPRHRDPFEVKVNPAGNVDAAELFEQHEREVADGTLARLQTFDRAARVASNEADLAQAVEAANKACGTRLTGAIDLSKVEEEQLRTWGYGTICGHTFEVLAELCAMPAARPFVTNDVSRVECAIGPQDKPDVFTLENKTLRYTTGEMSNVDEHLRAFVGAIGGSELSLKRSVPWGDGSSLRDRITASQMLVCADDKGHVVARDVHAYRDGDASFTDAIYTGSRKALHRVQNTGRYPLDFVEPRYLRTGATGSQRFFSSLIFDESQKQCVVQCGDRSTKVPMLSAEEASKLVLEAKYVEPPFDRVPYTLLRDRTGTYYYVDTSSLPNREKDFHVYVGQRGKMKKLQLTNVVSDTAGNLFTTRTGELRLSLDREKGSFWHEKKNNVALRDVPVEENYDVIFNELGVYTGRLGNPCDDF